MPTADISLLLIEKKMAGNFGLAPAKWRRQLEEIRGLPEFGCPPLSPPR